MAPVNYKIKIKQTSNVGMRGDSIHLAIFGGRGGVLSKIIFLGGLCPGGGGEGRIMGIPPY